ncbi:Methylenetetrahydrofolate reductase [Acidipropionibacterium acidipropionici ATCC 4875]|uniref:Methylenetetrahydrofolate reductase n=1 Tax=Acidipropionibacterium acidipropionici (strain ATCC 4875 / DSM 20272 / JCM 6432 / NBRC 12425 / NCIMB 8070 / 4) TaxID=1171373 RepID=K7SIH2_ACIA4|nr:methylenetetrahydrofolate reductase [Acidipropionibacterium acidipropionici]AFV89075.1 Methylenetetrahydrofolate reductase [Acidipropionibacterium acidipropionici ATCC 4875]ALN16347.1 5,10-methylenetetrahydrofolate reductase [Acidipropionibacterium acidipropionici]APZ10600.1 5,10-methylenetetrahydrofolate reductase [Acidipropionibacterium acidipropionici]MDN6556461.1 methylenetetrahydrofolate reductase [Acidipropionibacterium acidipropionici]
MLSTTSPAETIAELLTRAERPLTSFEFMPPRSEEDVYRLWRATDELVPLRPDFISVTYGANGSRRDRTLRCTQHMVASGLRTVGHLTAVSQSVAELEQTVSDYHDAGVDHILAIRGDMPGGAAEPWVARPDGLANATELVRLVKRVNPGACVGVGAFPDCHPASGDLDLDARIVAEKAEAGASFAITQLFFIPEHYTDLVARVRALGCGIPIIPGIMPITSFSQIRRFGELSGTDVPADLVARLSEVAEDRAAVREIGLEAAARLSCRLLDEGAPGLHYYTLNRSRATTELHAMVRDRRPGLWDR